MFFLKGFMAAFHFCFSWVPAGVIYGFGWVVGSIISIYIILILIILGIGLIGSMLN